MTEQDTKDDLYEVLGLGEGATADDVKRSYVRMVRKFRPEQHPELFRKINRAKDVLSDPRRRAEYDQYRRFGEQVNVLMEEAEGVMASQPERAVRLLKEAVALTPEVFMPRFLLAHAFIQTEDFIAAETQLRRLLQHSPENASLYYNLAGCLKMQGMTDGAEQSLSRALELNPHYHDALILLARVYMDRRMVTEATHTLERAILLNGSEDINDLPVLLQLMSVHLLVDNAPAFARVNERILATVKDAEDAHHVISKMYDLAFDLCGSGNFSAAFKVIQSARHPLATDSELRGAVEEAVEKIGARADAARLVADPTIARSVQSYVAWKYLDTENKLEHLREQVIAALEAELRADPTQAGNLLRLLHSRYPRLAAEEGEFLRFLEDRGRSRYEPTSRQGVGGAVSVRDVPPTKKEFSIASCAVMILCGGVLQLLIPVPLLGFAIGVFLGAIIASALQL